ncbi:MAG: hypothetical protein HRU09_13695 [Oligoflexales bacterium]|nr:hypothetical protein [Oligoflexales bacterium]
MTRAEKPNKPQKEQKQAKQPKKRPLLVYLEQLADHVDAEVAKIMNTK